MDKASMPPAPPFRVPIAYKLAIIMSLITLLGLGSLWGITNANLGDLVGQQAQAFGQLVAQQTANSSTEPLLADDTLSLNVITSKVVATDNLLAAAIYDHEGQPIAQSGQPVSSNRARALLAPMMKGEQSDNALIGPGLYAHAIRFQDVRAGYAVIQLDPSPMIAGIDRLIRWLAIATIGLLAFCVILTLLLSQNLVRPIQKLISGTSAIRAGNLDYRITEARKDEFGDLIETFNDMAQGLKEKDQLTDTFKRYVPDQVASSLLADLNRPTLPHQYVNASVLFIDIVGFTSMCEHMAPQEVAQLLNGAYRLVLQASSLYDGVVDKFMGDGAMIIFGAPEQDNEHCFNAIRCAQLFLGLVEQQNQRYAKENLPQIRFRLGLHCGEMLAGTLGTNERMQYTVVGDTVNLASRLCHLGDPGALIISHDVYIGADGDNRLHADNKRQIKVRGKSQKITTYTVSALQEPHHSRIEDEIHRVVSFRHRLKPGSNQIECPPVASVN